MTTALITHPACLDHDPGPYHPESSERLRAVLDALASGQNPRPGPQVERQTSCPEGGPTSLKKMAERNYDYRGQW